MFADDLGNGPRQHHFFGNTWSFVFFHVIGSRPIKDQNLIPGYNKYVCAVTVSFVHAQHQCSMGVTNMNLKVHWNTKYWCFYVSPCNFCTIIQVKIIILCTLVYFHMIYSWAIPVNSCSVDKVGQRNDKYVFFLLTNSQIIPCYAMHVMSLRESVMSASALLYEDYYF